MRDTINQFKDCLKEDTPGFWPAFLLLISSSIAITFIICSLLYSEVYLKYFVG